LSTEPLTAARRPDLLGGVVTISGQRRDGTPVLAIPNYTRMNSAGPLTEFPVRAKGPVLSQVEVKA
jgi:hypothetical protein